MSENKDKNPKGEHGNRVLELTINGKKYEWNQQYITGDEIRRLGRIAKDEEIFLAVKKPWEDEPIPDDKQVNLARPEIEHFYSKAKELTIVVNGTPHKWAIEKISFKEVIVLAFGQYIDKPTMVYTVAYEDGPRQNPEGSMFVGQEVLVKHKMIFNASQTDKS
jgi:hypothetical protein